MIYTDYHASYIAHELTKRYATDNQEKLAGALVDAQIECWRLQQITTLVLLSP